MMVKTKNAWINTDNIGWIEINRSNKHASPSTPGLYSVRVDGSWLEIEESDIEKILKAMGAK